MWTLISLDSSSFSDDPGWATLLYEYSVFTVILYVQGFVENYIY
uniref:Uncharacterized protein n=1 Tax=Arundo donax TaxID=35708 RepID=A0A0A9HJZ6_ARUDO